MEVREEHTINGKHTTYFENGKYGIINMSGTHITEPIYDEIKYDGNERFIVKTSKDKVINYGVIDVNGKVIIPVCYSNIRGFRKKLYECFPQKVLLTKDSLDIVEGNKIKWIDGKGHIIYESNQDGFDTIGNYYLLSSEFIVNKHLHPSKPFRFDRIIRINEDYFLIENNSKFGLVTKDGYNVLAPTFDEGYFFDMGVIWRQYFYDGKYECTYLGLNKNDIWVNYTKKTIESKQFSTIIKANCNNDGKSLNSYLISKDAILKLTIKGENYAYSLKEKKLHHIAGEFIKQINSNFIVTKEYGKYNIYDITIGKTVFEKALKQLNIYNNRLLQGLVNDQNIDDITEDNYFLVGPDFVDYDCEKRDYAHDLGVLLYENIKIDH